MKRAKRFLSILLTLCMVLGMIPGTVLAANSSMPFTDVKETDWFYDAVQYVYEEGLMKGTSDTAFDPNGQTTRGMVVTILHRMEGKPSVSGEKFADVTAGQYYADAVAWASANGIVGGYGNGKFGPNDPITREQLAAILYRYAQYKGYDDAVTGDISVFADGNQVSSYAIEAMNWAIGMDLISGIGNNKLASSSRATRAQVSTILMRFCKNIVQAAGSNEDTGSGKNSIILNPFLPMDTYFIVTFDSNGGSAVESQVIKNGATAVEPEVPVLDGYTFTGWYSDVALTEVYDFTTPVTANITLHAAWEKAIVSQLSISFDEHNAVVTQPDVVLSGSYYSPESVLSITYSLTGECSDYQDHTGNASFADGRWEIPELRLVPDCSRITIMITDTKGNTAQQTESITFDTGTLVDPELVKIEQDKESGLKYASNILLVFFADETTQAQKDKVVHSVNGKIVGQDNFLNMVQILVNPVSLEQANFLSNQLEQAYPETVELASFDIAFESESDPFNDPWTANVLWDYGEAEENSDWKEGGIQPEGWDDNNPGGSNWNFEVIEATTAWQLYGSKFRPIRVGVIDMGFNQAHEDLLGKIIFPNRDAEKRNKPYSHGMHVSGIIAAQANNKRGITGVANQATVIASPNRMQAYSFTSDIVKGLEETVLSGAKVVNLSAGLTDLLNIETLTRGFTLNPIEAMNTNIALSFVSASAKAACYSMSKLLSKGFDFVVVQASGNGSKEGYACDAIYNGGFSTICKQFQMLYKNTTLEQVTDRIMIVGNAQINKDGSYKQYFCSNAGDQVDLCAPGRQVLSCSASNNGYVIMGGTSMAAPHVAAVAALTWSVNSGLSGAQIKQILCNNYNRIVEDNTGANSQYSAGRYPMVNALLSVRKALIMKNDSIPLHVTVVEKTVDCEIEPDSLYASVVDEIQPQGYQRVEVAWRWQYNTNVILTLPTPTHPTERFTSAQIQEAYKTYPSRWKDDLGNLQNDPVERIANIRTSLPTSINSYPLYMLFLSMDRDYNVLGHIVLKIDIAH